MQIPTLRRLFSIAAVLALFAVSPLAQSKDHDQSLTINIAEGCVSDVVAADPSNCDPSSSCKKQDGCVCIKPDKHISWASSDGTNFTLTAKSGSGWPFKKCKDSRDGSMTCKVEKDAADGDYLYNIEIGGCEVYDPRIIIQR